MNFNISTRPKIPRNKWGYSYGGKNGSSTTNITYVLGNDNPNNITNNKLESVLKDYVTEEEFQEVINNMDNGHVLLTESEYNNLPEKDEKTVYMIKGSHFILLTNLEYTNLRQKDESKIYLITT